MAWDGVLVRFGEIGIKSAPVRSSMLERLRRNLLDSLLRLGVEGNAERRGARIWMSGPDPDALAQAAAMTFGVVSASPCRRVAGTLEAVGAAATELALARGGWRRFAIRARREGGHGFSSQDIGVHAGSAVYRAMQAAGRPVEVDLSTPELEVHIDVRQDTAYVFTDHVVGPGGLPMGAQGKALVLLSDPASALAAWLIMRRGAAVTALHAGHTGSVPVDAVEALARWGMSRDVELLPVCSGTTSKEALLAAAAEVAREQEASVLVTGDTLESRLLMAPMPLLRPVCGLDRASYEQFMRVAGIPADDDGHHILDAASRETAASLHSMRRTVSV